MVLLRGGVLPNYPEHDGIDNDGDNAVLVADGLDNNGNGGVDGAGEGIDEGRRERWQTTQRTAPGEFSIYSLEYTTTLETFLPGDPTVAGYPVDYPLYLGTWRDHPEWKALVERRMYPGDLVVVTLYDGPGEDRKVVDRVTYSEKDVVNRAVDDVRACPYVVDLNGDGSLDLNGGTLPETPGLDPRFLSWWPDNTMGIDFYRSLPRKHPFYTGDRFGHANRWTATDGAYDDWAPSFGPWKDAATHWLDVVADRRNTDMLSGAHRCGRTCLNGSSTSDRPAGSWIRAPVARLGCRVRRLGLDWQTVRNRSFSSPQQVLEMPHLMMRGTAVHVGSRRSITLLSATSRNARWPGSPSCTPTTPRPARPTSR